MKQVLFILVLVGAGVVFGITMPPAKNESLEDKMSKAARRQAQLKIQFAKSKLDKILKATPHLYQSCLDHVTSLGYDGQQEGKATLI